MGVVLFVLKCDVVNVVVLLNGSVEYVFVFDV